MKLLSTLLCLCTAVATFAQDSKIPKKIDNLAASYAEATAYFEIVAEALEKSGRESSKAKAVRDDAMLYSLLLAAEGRTQELAVKVIYARIGVNKKNMLKEMDYRNENIAIIMNKYSESSLDLMRNPPKEVLELVEKAARTVKNAPESGSKEK